MLQYKQQQQHQTTLSGKVRVFVVNMNNHTVRIFPYIVVYTDMIRTVNL